MSQWHEAKDSDIDIDTIKKEFNIFVADDDLGSVYLTITFAQVRALALIVEADGKP